MLLTPRDALGNANASFTISGEQGEQTLQVRTSQPCFGSAAIAPDLWMAISLCLTSLAASLASTAACPVQQQGCVCRSRACACPLAAYSWAVAWRLWLRIGSCRDITCGRASLRAGALLSWYLCEVGARNCGTAS